MKIRKAFISTIFTIKKKLGSNIKIKISLNNPANIYVFKVTIFMPFSDVPIGDFEQVNVSWESPRKS